MLKSIAFDIIFIIILFTLIACLPGSLQKQEKYQIGNCLKKELVESWEYDIVWIVLEVGKQSYLLAPFSSALSGEDRLTINFNNTEYKKIPCNP